MDDSIMDGDSIFNISDDENSDFVPEKPAPVSLTRLVGILSQVVTDSLASQKAKAKAAPKKAAAAKPKAAAKKAPVKKTAAKKKAKADSEDEMSDVHMSDDDAGSLLSQTPPKGKKAAAPKRAGSKPLADVENESFGGDAAQDAPGEISVADKYRKVSCARQVILLRLLIKVDGFGSLRNSNTLPNVLIPTLVPSNAQLNRCGFTTLKQIPWSSARYHSSPVSTRFSTRSLSTPPITRKMTRT
jgi:hypothetical protein